MDSNIIPEEIFITLDKLSSYGYYNPATIVTPVMADNLIACYILYASVTNNPISKVFTSLFLKLLEGDFLLSGEEIKVFISTILIYNPSTMSYIIDYCNSLRDLLAT